METNAPDTGGAGEDLLPYLERLWRIPARAPAHDPQASRWLTCAWVSALIGCGSALGAAASASIIPLLVAAILAAVSAAIALVHHHTRKRRIARWH